MANWFGKTAPPEGEDSVQETELLTTGDTLQAELPPEVEAVAEGEVINAEHAESTALSVPEAEVRSLALLAQARFAIAEASSLEEIKTIRDKSEAIRKYAQAAGLGLELQNQAAEIKLRAERKAGSFLSKLKLHGGDRRDETSSDRVTLEAIGISKDQSSRWQLAAAVPERVFAKYLEETQSVQGEVTTSGLIRIARELRTKHRRSEQPSTAETEVTECELVRNLNDLVGGKRFACVYVDAPWPVGPHPEKEKVVTLNLFRSTLCMDPIADLIEEHAHLHIWATDESYQAALSVMQSWGFEFKGTLVRVGHEGRPGNYWTEAHEYLLLGVRGNLPLMESGLQSWVRASREDDGAPPERVRRLIERVSPGPYLEVFGRKPVSGWTIVNGLPMASSDPIPLAEEGASDAEATSA